jgi:hypothetical protein
MADTNPTVSRALDFLKRNNAFAFDKSPWESLNENETAHEFHWDRFFGADPGLELPGEFLAEIEGILESRDDSWAPSGRPTGTGTQWDVCAWYQPMHFFGPAWGIYIREACMLRLAVDITRNTNFSELRRELATAKGTKYAGHHPAIPLVRAAFLILFLHEHYHHRTECLGFRLHVVTRAPHYVPYFRGIYNSCKGTDDQIEEALANAAMYLRLEEPTYANFLPASIRKAARTMLLAQFPHDPPGYRMAMSYLKKAAFDAGENLLQGRVRELTLAPAQPAIDWDSAPRLTQSFFNIKSHIYSVVPAGARSVLPPSVFP